MILALALTLALAEGTLTENVATRADAQQTYTLYLPSTYDAAKKHPLLLVFDPRGRGTLAAERFREAAEEHGWIVISSNGTRSDDDGSSNKRAIPALLADVDRYAVDRRRIYAAGFSGTAIFACAVGINTNELAGVIGAGGRVVDQVPPARFSFAHYGFAGDVDFNNREMRQLDALLEKAGKPHRFTQFEGDHRWMPRELAAEAVAWMEVIAMKEKRRPRDESLIAKLYAADAAAARNLAGLDALRRWQAIARTFDGLHAIDDARAAIAKLEADASVQRALRDEAKWDDFEQAYTRDVVLRLPAIFRGLQQEGRQITPARLSRELRVAQLGKHAASRDATESRTARRILGSLVAQTRFYIPRVGDAALVRALEGVAEEIRSAAATR